MDTIQLTHEKISVRTEITELTYSEQVLFQQYFNKILYDIDEIKLETIYSEMKKLFNLANYAEMLLTFDNFYQGLKLQIVGSNAWLVCFGILAEKKEPIFDENKLIDIVRTYEMDGLTEKDIKTAVELFTQAFPLTWQVYQLRAEGLNNLINQISKAI